jgi:ABC-2 type transport system permease protein
LLILGGAFFPIRFLPETLLELAKINPIYHMNQALLAVSTQGDNVQDIASHFQFLSGFTLMMILGGWLSYRRMVMLEKRL